MNNLDNNEAYEIPLSTEKPNIISQNLRNRVTLVLPLVLLLAAVSACDDNVLNEPMDQLDETDVSSDQIEEDATTDTLSIDEVEVVSPQDLVTRCEFFEMLYPHTGFSTDRPDNHIFIDLDPTEYPECNEAVVAFYDNGILDGFPDGTIKPDNLINRAEATKFTVQSLDLPELICPERQFFNDVDDTHWYGPYVNDLACVGLACNLDTDENGLLCNGDCFMSSDFQPAESVTHEWMNILEENIIDGLENDPFAGTCE